MRLQRIQKNDVIEWHLCIESDINDFRLAAEMSNEFRSMRIRTDEGEQPYIVIKKKKIQQGVIDGLITDGLIEEVIQDSKSV